MKTREIVSRCLKARFVSWITVSRQAVVLPTLDGGGVIIAVFDNGRHYAPQGGDIPDGVPEGWDMDGPIRPSQPPGKPEGDDDAPAA